jgi:hypothetical protein
MWEAIMTRPQRPRASPALCADDQRPEGIDGIKSMLPTFSPKEAKCLQHERHEHQNADEHDGLDCPCQNEYEYGEHDRGNDQQ